MLHAALEDCGDDDLNDGFPGFFFHGCDVFNFEHKDTKTQRLKIFSFSHYLNLSISKELCASVLSVLK